MITIIVLQGGKEVIGDTIVFDDYIEVHSPMYIVDSEAGLKLQDSLLLGDNNKLIFKVKDIITYYKPIDILTTYYRKVVEFSTKHTKEITLRQIKYATEELDEWLNKRSNKIKNIMNTHATSSTTLH